jgi:hypothetical protein
MLTPKKPYGMSRAELWSWRLLWLMAFLLLLPIAIAARVTGWRWKPWSPGPGGYRSCFREADSIANLFVGITHAAH